MSLSRLVPQRKRIIIEESDDDDDEVVMPLSRLAPQRKRIIIEESDDDDDEVVMPLSRLALPRKRRIIEESDDDDNEVVPSRDHLFVEINKLRKEANDELVNKNAEQESQIMKLKERLQVKMFLRKEYQFPLISLPKEIITYIFSFLSIKDRMRARLNKTLDAIALNSNYSVKHLTIKEVASNGWEMKFRGDDSLEHQRIYFLKSKKYWSEGIKRILRSTTIERLTISLSAWKMTHFEIYNMIKEFKFGRLDVHIEKPDKKKAITVMDDSLFLGLTRSCKHLSMAYCNSDAITPEALHQVYKGMKDGSTNLRELEMEINEDIRRGFLLLIGITYRYRDGIRRSNTDNKLFTNKKLEAYMLKDTISNFQFAHIFDDNLEIIFRNFLHKDFKMLLHETQESLDKAKKRKRFVRIDMTPK